MDPISGTTFNIDSPNLGTASAAQQSSGSNGGDVSIIDVNHFQTLHQSAPVKTEMTSAVQSVETTGLESAVNMLKDLNGSVASIGEEALNLQAELHDLSPGQMLKLTVQAQQFLFQSQLTANVANRTSEGVQQLFRQQS
ncbi:hypothetical protein OLMES_5454 [Oleiphilus messinensis]|uniref:Uncharacterized protein n=1 Tax=Oleiphilus messinensis TaxID=141451 RepID=A0A1Y0IJ66_9GAMM|nr:hypothetical protein [Oleiphilus messinensis]ARU59434.1 hypothetical protein OLMES_5454 [Oleiphilus messinensis]